MTDFVIFFTTLFSLGWTEEWHFKTQQSENNKTHE
jgi:hypothetical protein